MTLCIERRGEARLALQGRGCVELPELGEHDCVYLDVSVGGAALLVSQALAPRARVPLELNLCGGRTFRGQAEVIRVRSSQHGFVHGMRFVGLTAEARTQLRRDLLSLREEAEREKARRTGEQSGTHYATDEQTSTISFAGAIPFRVEQDPSWNTLFVELGDDARAPAENEQVACSDDDEPEEWDTLFSSEHVDDVDWATIAGNNFTQVTAANDICERARKTG